MYEYIERFYAQNKSSLIEGDLRPTKSYSKEPENYIEKLRDFYKKKKSVGPFKEDDFAEALNVTKGSNVVNETLDTMHVLNLIKYKKAEKEASFTNAFVAFVNSDAKPISYIFNLLCSVKSLDTISSWINLIICTLREGYLYGEIIDFPDDTKKFEEEVKSSNKEDYLSRIKNVYGYSGRVGSSAPYTPNLTQRSIKQLINLGFVYEDGNTLEKWKTYKITPFGHNYLRLLNLNFCGTDDFITEDEYFNSDSVKQKIFFGAPGTGKSFTLNEIAKKFVKQENFDLAGAIKKAFEKINPQENFVPQCFAIGMKYAKEILEKYPKNTQKEINSAIGKEKEDDIAGYYILTGAQAAAFFPNTKSTCLGNKFVERVTFHPNYSYAQFVGCYKPIAKTTGITNNLPADKKQILDILTDKSRRGQEKYDLLYDQFKSEDSLTRLPLLIGIYSDDEFHTKKADGTAAANDNSVERNHGRAIRPYVSLFDKMSNKEDISYEYVPGPFMRTYVAAKKNPGQKFLLIIEEINRANVAAVFGDVFQLLDRKNGVSEYPVAASEDIKKYLKDNGIDDCEELRIPDNMYIWATMNSADQGVFPMDTAFKRRWEFEYIGINEKEEEIKDYEIPMQKNDDGTREWMKWNDLRNSINNKLTSLGLNEDKLLGPYFISKEKLEMIKDKKEEKAREFIKSFESKVLMYLFEDAAKMHHSKLFNGEKIELLRFSNICEQFEKIGVDIFLFDKQ